CASPGVLRGPSTRRVSRPIGEAAVTCSVVAIFAPVRGSGRCQCQRVCQAALGQFDLETALTLGLRGSQRCLSSLAKAGLVGGSAGERRLGFRGAATVFR